MRVTVALLLTLSLSQLSWSCYSYLTYDQIMFNIEKAHMILDEMIMNGHITETNKNRALAPIVVLDKAVKQLNL